MSAAKTKKQRKPVEPASRPWEPILAIGIAIGLVVAIFLFTNRPSEPEPAAAPPPTQELATPNTLPPISPADVAEVDRIDVDETKRLLDEGRAITIDVRDVQSYMAGHIPGALQIPLQYVAGEVPWFPRDKMIITYCT